MNHEPILGLDGRELAAVIRLRPPWDGAEFFGRPEDILQVGAQRLPEGRVVPAHFHRAVERTTVGTAEAILVLFGMLEVTVFDGVDPVGSARLGSGDAVLLRPGGGHAMRALVETTIFEVKNGPYLGRETDKEMFDGAEKV